MIIEILTLENTHAFLISEIESVSMNKKPLYDNLNKSNNNACYLLIVKTKNHSHVISYKESEKQRDKAYFKLLSAIDPCYDPNSVSEM